MIINPLAERFFPLKEAQSISIMTTDYDDPNEFIPKRTKLEHGRLLISLGLLSAIFMADPIPHIDFLQ